MKKNILLLTLFSICYLLYSNAEITFENLSYDFGEIKEENGPYENTFVFTNTGTEPFKLTNVKAG